MSIPDYQTLMRPLLDLSAEVGSSTLSALRDELSKRMGLSEVPRNELRDPRARRGRWRWRR